MILSLSYANCFTLVLYAARAFIEPHRWILSRFSSTLILSEPSNREAGVGEFLSGPQDAEIECHPLELHSRTH